MNSFVPSDKIHFDFSQDLRLGCSFASKFLSSKGARQLEGYEEIFGLQSDTLKEALRVPLILAKAI